MFWRILLQLELDELVTGSIKEVKYKRGINQSLAALF